MHIVVSVEIVVTADQAGFTQKHVKREILYAIACVATAEHRKTMPPPRSIPRVAQLERLSIRAAQVCVYRGDKVVVLEHLQRIFTKNTLWD